MRPPRFPTYCQLLRAPTRRRARSWGLFGEHDELGTLNLLTASMRGRAPRLVRSGEVFALNWNVELPDPSPFRQPPVRHQIGAGGVGRDDWLDRFYLQGSSQWDALRHIAHPRLGFYNGVSADRVDDPAGDALGIQGVARRGIVGRGVLLDVARHQEANGRPFRANECFQISAELLDEVARAEGTAIEPADLLLVRTGWTGGTRRCRRRSGTRSIGRRRSPGSHPSSGRPNGSGTSGFAAVAATTSRSSACRSISARGGACTSGSSPASACRSASSGGSTDLAAACARDGRWTFQLVSAPLNVRGGVGSPPNALAVR